MDIIGSSAIKITKEEVDPDLIYTSKISDLDLLFHSITMPPWQEIMTMGDIGTLEWIATSKSLAGDAQKRQQYMKEVMEKRGFKFMAGGTNRNVYKHLDLPGIVAKVPIDKVGMGDNLAEMENQHKIWPYCAKTIQVTPGGIVGFAERLNPILNRAQFNAYALMVYTSTLKIIGKYVLEDIGEKYFKNWGVRRGMGCALVDYPYIFELDGSKLICKNTLPNGTCCFGEIDYDGGFNHLSCKRCGRRYHAADLQLTLNLVQMKPKIKRGGKKPMKVRFMCGDEVIASDYSSDSIVRPNPMAPARPRASTRMKVSLVSSDGVVESSSEIPPTVEIPKIEQSSIDPTRESATTTVGIEAGEPIQQSTVTAEEIVAAMSADELASLAEAYRNGIGAVGGFDVVSGGETDTGIYVNLANGDRIDIPWEKLTEAISIEHAGDFAADRMEDHMAAPPAEEEEPAPAPQEEAHQPIPETGLNIPSDALNAVDKTIDGADEFTTTSSESVLDEPTPAALEAEKEDEFPPNQWGSGASVNRPTRRRVMTSEEPNSVTTKRHNK